MCVGLEQLKLCISDMFENAYFFSLGLLSRMNQIQKYSLQEKLLLGMYLI